MQVASCVFNLTHKPEKLLKCFKCNLNSKKIKYQETDGYERDKRLEIEKLKGNND